MGTGQTIENAADVPTTGQWQSNQEAQDNGSTAALPDKSLH